jgi:CRP/FNR family cyclic AMP-dependent transcriptional regulator
MPEVRTYFEALMALDETPLKLDPGQVIFKEGETGHEMFVVRTGTVDLKLGDDVVETVGQGGVFGEMALVDPAPRSATAVAGPNCSLVLVEQHSFNDLLTRVPGLGLEIMRVMARRLRKASHPL